VFAFLLRSMRLLSLFTFDGFLLTPGALAQPPSDVGMALLEHRGPRQILEF